MKKNLVGIVQGRLSKAPHKSLQVFPRNFETEFKTANLITYDYIELIAERKKNKNNPIWTNHGNKKYIKLSKKYNKKLLNFCDDHAISQSILGNYYHKYFIHLLKILSSLKIKNFILPLYGKSKITDNNYLKFDKKINSLRKIASNKKINLLIESNISPSTFRKLTAYKKKNFFFVFDTGNRANLKKNNLYSDIINFGKKIGLVHLKDKDSSNQNVKFGDGIVNFNKIFVSLKKINYKRNFTIESVRGKRPEITAKRNLVFFKNLINKKLN